MKQYNICITWESAENFKVEAENLEDAVRKAVKEFLAIPDNNYLTDSFRVDEMVYDEYPDEPLDMNKIMKEL